MVDGEVGAREFDARQSSITPSASDEEQQYQNQRHDRDHEYGKGRRGETGGSAFGSRLTKGTLVFFSDAAGHNQVRSVIGFIPFVLFERTSPSTDRAEA